jgi:universal stress protein E
VKRTIRKILLCVGNSGHVAAHTLRKVAAIARGTGAQVELFHAVRELESPVTAIGNGPRRARKIRDAAVPARYLTRLDKAARSDLLRGLKVSCCVELDYPAHEAIVRRVMRAAVDLVVVPMHRHAPGSSLLLRYTDWELVRHCPVPLLLVKSARAYSRPSIVVSVDPFHAHAKPANLDERLIENGTALSQALRGNVHVFHSYMPLVTFVPAPMGVNLPAGLPPEMENAHALQISQVLDRLAQRHGVPGSRTHLHMGIVQDELAAVVRRVHAGVVVMGALSRAGLKRLFIGNTAERTLDGLTCDVLVVKPRNFRSGIAPAKA